ncbi:MAG: AAA family ATPase [Myxococcota bacterium]
MALRIAVSGSAGVGKSTLARRLAERLGVAYIGEGMREYLERTGTDLHALGHEGVRALVLTLWEERKEAEHAARSFVADRSSYDFAAFWLYYHFAAEDDDTARLFAETLTPRRYDVVYLLPWGRIPLIADGIRTPNPWTQLHLQLILEGLLRKHAPETVGIESVGVEDRVEEIVARIG